MARSDIEDLDSFRTRAQIWIARNLPTRDDPGDLDDRSLQNMIFDAGYAGLAYPIEYGGAGLTFDHQKVFFAEAAGHRTPSGYGVSIGILGPTLLDFAPEALRARHLPRILRGDELWIQLLSEPTGGSDMAGALTRLTRDGDTYILDGSKMWSTGALYSDFGLCLARTDWEAPKHRGLSMIAVPLQGTSGLTVKPIRTVTGEVGTFCVEFFDDVTLPAENLVGAENEGWVVAQRLLLHERNAGNGIEHGIGLFGTGSDILGWGTYEDVADGAFRRGLSDDVVLGHRGVETYIEATVRRCAADRLMTGLRTGALKGQWASLLKLHLGVQSNKDAKSALATWGADGVIWDGDEKLAGNAGETFLRSRGPSIAGGTNEIHRNIISERLLGLPREPSVDRDLPFNEVIRNRQTF
jgi:alkylation response protein AidB-like acyl-CoA dehydrogenase